MTATDRRTLYTMTLRQYEAAVRAAFFGENPTSGITRAEYDRCYPAGCRAVDWAQMLRAAARHGAILRREVLDDLAHRAPGVLRSIAHDFGLPPGYLPPTVRAYHKQYAAEMRAARRRGQRAAAEGVTG